MIEPHFWSPIYSLFSQHAHVSMGEVIGLLGGMYKEDEKVLKVRLKHLFVVSILLSDRNACHIVHSLHLVYVCSFIC